MIALREQLLPASPRRRSWAGSALDPGWMDEVDPERGVLVTAQGLLMYFARDDAHGLIAACAQRFPGGAMVFDAVPAWLAQREPPQQAGFRPPPWEWGMDPDEERALAELPGVAVLRVLRPPRGRGVPGVVLPLASRVGALRRLMLSILGARFAVR
jgi:hypothetical protein